MSEKKVRFKFDPRISLSTTKPIQTNYNSIQSLQQKTNQLCENCGFFQPDVNDHTATCKKCLVTNKGLNPRAHSFSKSEQNLNKLTNATNVINKNVNIQLPIEITNYLKKKSKEFESIDEKKLNSPKKFQSFQFKSEPRTNEYIWKCNNCNEILNSGEVAVSAEPVFDSLARWHVKCFVCCVCNNVLADLLYYSKDKKLYCKKHYNALTESVTTKPSLVCAACDTKIESNEFIKAENKYWHYDHFTCWNCEKSLAGKRYIVVDSKPYCFECHLVHFSKKCQTCQKKIQQDITRLTYDNLDWHAEPQCFKCHTCQKSLLDTHFLLKKNQLFCSIDCKKNSFLS